METTYSIYRGWADGESMEPHLMHASIPTLEAAMDKSRLGGYVVRDSDGASLMPKADGGNCWVDDATGEEVQ